MTQSQTFWGEMYDPGLRLHPLLLFILDHRVISGHTHVPSRRPQVCLAARSFYEGTLTTPAPLATTFTEPASKGYCIHAVFLCICQVYTKVIPVGNDVQEAMYIHPDAVNSCTQVAR